MFENVPIIEHLHSKFAKSTNMTGKNFFLLKKDNMGIKKTQNFVLIPNSLKWVEKTCSEEKLCTKNIGKKS